MKKYIIGIDNEDCTQMYIRADAFRYRDCDCGENYEIEFFVGEQQIAAFTNVSYFAEETFVG